MHWPHMRQSQIASLRGFSMASTRRSTTRTVLPLFERLIDELDSLGERRILRGLRGADDLLRHPGGNRGVGRAMIRAGELGVLLGDRGAAHHDRNFFAQAGLLQRL